MGLEVPRLGDEHCSMCGRFASTLPPDRIREIFQTIGSVPNHAPNWNVAPTQSALVVRRHPDCGERRLDTLTWGLIPSFNKDAKGGRKPINARAETIASFGIVRGAFQARRCIVPIDAFYEWETTSTGKQPYAFARADGTPALAIAGLWESWRDPAGEIRRTFTIATTAANGFMSRIHDRMPVILEPDAWSTWLGEKPGDPAALLRPAAEDVLRSWPVSRDVNLPRHNRPDLLDQVELPTTPADEEEAGPDSA